MLTITIYKMSNTSGCYPVVIKISLIKITKFCKVSNYELE